MPTRRFKGTIHYRQDRTFLDLGNGSVPALAIDRPPMGVTNIEDFVAATNYFRDFLQIQEGGSVTVEGYLTSFGPMQVIQVTRVV